MSYQDCKSLVLVVGAGASKEVGLPVGFELKKIISQALDLRFDYVGSQESGDKVINSAIDFITKQDKSGERNSYINAARQISRAMPQAISIDNFIDTHQGNRHIEVCGKLAIARCIIEAEQKSILYFDHKDPNSNINYQPLGDTWYNSFFQLLTENCQKGQLRHRLSKVSIISFNYDRCIEHFLYCALQNYYASMTPEEAADLVKGLNIFHPYGTVGPLHWEDRTHGTRFGEIPRIEKLAGIAEQLRTFTEGVNPNQSEIISIRQTLRMAKRIAFLGFAFHELNLRLLFDDEEITPRAREDVVFGTAHGISLSDINLIKADLSRRARIDLQSIGLDFNSTAALLFKNYWRSLTLL